MNKHTARITVHSSWAFEFLLHKTYYLIHFNSEELYSYMSIDIAIFLSLIQTIQIRIWIPVLVHRLITKNNTHWVLRRNTNHLCRSLLLARDLSLFWLMSDLCWNLF